LRLGPATPAIRISNPVADKVGRPGQATRLSAGDRFLLFSWKTRAAKSDLLCSILRHQNQRLQRRILPLGTSSSINSRTYRIIPPHPLLSIDFLLPLSFPTPTTVDLLSTADCQYFIENNSFISTITCAATTRCKSRFLALAGHANQPLASHCLGGSSQD